MDFKITIPKLLIQSWCYFNVIEMILILHI